MAETRNRYLRILKIEIEDLAQDIAELVTHYGNKLSDGKITDYVYLENVSLIQHEVACLKELLRELDGLDPAAYADLPGTIRAVERVLEHACGSGLPESIRTILRRKIEKTRRYVLAP
jgi:hypothetical protein